MEKKRPKNESCVLSEEKREAIEKLKNPEESRKLLHIYGKLAISPELGYKKGAELLIKVLEGGTLSEEENKKFNNIIMGTNVTESHRMLIEVALDDRDRMAMIELANDLIVEYRCETVSERSLCEIIVNSYTQVLKISEKMTSTMNACKYLSHERNGYINVLSKELDRANRSYLSALNTLREIKSPSFNINIKTNTAIIGTNQQFNNNLLPNENIEA